LGAFVSVVVPVAALVLSPQKAEGSVFDGFLSFSRNMAPYLDDKSTTEAPRTVALNGQILKVAVGSTTHRGARVKDFYLDQYIGTHQAFEKIAAQTGKKAPPTELTFGDDDEGGMVAFDAGRDLTLGSLKDRWVKFVHSHRIGDIGQIRYVQWHKEPGGGTRFLTMWTDQRFSLDKLMPPHGVDVDGGDVPNVPRLPGLQRVLALDEKGKPWSTRVYEGPGSVGSVATQLAFAMKQHDWVEDPRYAKSTNDSCTMRFDQGARTVILSIDQVDNMKVDLAVIAKGG
jgi:hypothetical protein